MESPSEPRKVDFRPKLTVDEAVAMLRNGDMEGVLQAVRHERISGMDAKKAWDEVLGEP